MPEIKEKPTVSIMQTATQVVPLSYIPPKIMCVPCSFGRLVPYDFTLIKDDNKLGRKLYKCDSCGGEAWIEYFTKNDTGGKK